MRVYIARDGRVFKSHDITLGAEPITVRYEALIFGGGVTITQERVHGGTVVKEEADIFFDNVEQIDKVVTALHELKEELEHLS